MSGEINEQKQTREETVWGGRDEHSTSGVFKVSWAGSGGIERQIFSRAVPGPGLTFLSKISPLPTPPPPPLPNQRKPQKKCFGYKQPKFREVSFSGKSIRGGDISSQLFDQNNIIRVSLPPSPHPHPTRHKKHTKNFLNFMQVFFFGKFSKFVCWRLTPPPGRVDAPSYRESWIHPWSTTETFKWQTEKRLNALRFASCKSGRSRISQMGRVGALTLWECQPIIWQNVCMKMKQGSQ